MPILMLILTAVGGAIWWWIRSNPREALDVAGDVATTVRNAPRKLAFRKQTKSHPVEGIDDARIAVCAIAQSFIELDDLPTKEQREKVHLLVRTKLRTSEEEAVEMEVLGRWLIGQCNDPNAAIQRLAKRLYKIDGDNAWSVLQDILAQLVAGDLSSRQLMAVDDLKRAFRK